MDDRHRVTMSRYNILMTDVTTDNVTLHNAVMYKHEYIMYTFVHKF